MERYYIFKLGLAILFYATYCVRHMFVYGLEADYNLDNNRNVLNPDPDYYQYFQGVDGKPGRDYPIYAYIPRTNFNCRGIESGYYADPDTDCQVFHICEEGKKISFLCPNGTIFQQSELICEWWNKVNCTNSPNLYGESAERLQNDVARRKSSRRVVSLNGSEKKHGAVMRVEERTSLRATKNGKDYPVRQQAPQYQRINNHRIPDNSEIEQHIEEAESNNRHLANAQNFLQSSQQTSFNEQAQRHPNHNYNFINQDDFKTSDKGEAIDNVNTKSVSRVKPTKKDIDKDTGNFINQNYDQGINRQSKKVDQSEKNDLNFGAKTGQPKGTTLKEYHVEFGSTNFGVDASTRSINEANIYSTTRSPYQLSQNEYDNSGASAALDINKENADLSIHSDVQKSSPAPTYYGTKLSNANVFSSTTTAPKDEDSSQQYVSINFSNQPKQAVASNNGKISRGNVKYNSSPDYYSGQQVKHTPARNDFKSTPVTTYSPPIKNRNFNTPQNEQKDKQEAPTQDNYNIPFPKHKSEVSNDQDSVGQFQSQESTTFVVKQDVPVVSTEASNQKSFDVEDLNSKNQESDETQVPQESSSFIKSSFNSITDNSFKTSSSPYPNHRSTYSDIKDTTYLEAPKVQSISSITAHLVTTQPINNGKPFVGSRVGTTLLPNQPTTLSKYTYLPTSTASSKPTVIFGVIRHKPTTEESPYGPPELHNLGTSTQLPISDRFNVGNTDKTLPGVESTTPVTNAVPTESFNIGNTENTIKPIVLPNLETTTIKPLELLVPDQGSLNFGIGEANVRHSYQEPTGTPLSDVYSSSTLKPLELYTGTDGTPIADRFNLGNTDKTRPTIETTTFVTNPVPTESFNVGNTDKTIKPNVVPTLGASTVKPLEIVVPEHGSLNKGDNEPNTVNNYNGLEPVNEPPFIKETVPLLYENPSALVSTNKIVDHATVYGNYVSTTQPSQSSISNTPYSPTVPTVTHSSTIYGSTSSSRSPKTYSQGVPIRFENGKDRISVHLSKNVGGQTQTKTQTNYIAGSLEPPRLKVNAVVRVGGDIGSTSTTTVAPYTQQNGFFVTKDFNGGESSYSVSSKAKTERPRPFSRTLSTGEQFNTGTTNADLNTISTIFPAYQISSARPFGVTQETPTTFFTTTPTPEFNVYDNVDSMMNVLQEIANYNSQKGFSEDSRPGLVIPPSVGPQTLHSLAQYFANELQNTDPEKDGLRQDFKETLTGLLTAMTVHGYNNLFNIETTTTPPSGEGQEGTKTRVGDDEDDKENNKANEESGNSGTGDSTDDDGLLSTTSLPELRQLARNFSLALSSYLNDPENFRKSLEGLRPTEPPPLDEKDNAETSTTDDELLNFSDADVKPSTPVIPSATWGYIVASASKGGIQDDVKNSLNPDLNTADSQSFIPGFNNVQVKEKEVTGQKEPKGFTELPPNHWTTSPRATQLWQKALSVNPAIVNEHLETTPSVIASSEEDTTEPELFNQEVLPGLTEPHSEISYDLRELPPLSLNSTQVRGILIDFMNHTKSDEHNRLNRILKQLNTSEAEFLDRMKEIESNPLTKRLILLLISECGANITQELGIPTDTPSRSSVSSGSLVSQSGETLTALASTASLTSSKVEPGNKENHYLDKLVHRHLSEDDQDARALQLLNSLYTIASRFGKKR